ncbi:hypothetical protein DL546_006224 [Coniochaeta pulveracea]|uniref:Uncharacterized protein n=1 Tax=Coniochaeta pulveracea TaxID=177199 RepID=A0A420YAQ1_9PEZI|nr:hypothetical protein DL546_006224 [Coniochaeta pulveracea]
MEKKPDNLEKRWAPKKRIRQDLIAAPVESGGVTVNIDLAYQVSLHRIHGVSQAAVCRDGEKKKAWQTYMSLSSDYSNQFAGVQEETTSHCCLAIGALASGFMLPDLLGRLVLKFLFLLASTVYYLGLEVLVTLMGSIALSFLTNPCRRRARGYSKASKETIVGW